jgi:hypothetical protein
VDELGTLAVAEMSALSSHSALEIARIRAIHEHIYVVV